MEHQRAVISLANGLESIAREVVIANANPLLSRFDILQEQTSSRHRRCFIAREHQEVDERTVQLRVFSADDADTASELLTFLLESHAAAQLSHAHIASSAKPEQLGDIHFCVSEHPKGAMTLRKLLDGKGWLDVEESLRITSQISEALRYAHQAEIWHLKLQPECVWVDAGNHIKVSDFGIPAKPTREWAYRRRSQDCCLNYRSPEQLGGGLPDERSDLYAVGVLLYEMLTDALPFQAQDERQLRHKIAVKKAPPMHLIRPDIPETLSAIVAKLLLENPAERFQNAALLQSALNQFLEPSWQAINLQTPDTAKAVEPENPQAEVETMAPLPMAAEARDPEINANPEPPIFNEPEFNEFAQSYAAALPQALVQPQALAIDEALPVAHIAAQEPPENIKVSVIESLRRWEFLPFTLLALGVVLLGVVSVLAVNGDFKSLFNSSSPAGQSEWQRALPVTEKSSLPNNPSQPQDIRNSAQLELATSSDAGSLSANKSSGESDASPALSAKRSAVSPALATQVSKLRQQLRRVNEANARNAKIRSRNSRGQSRPLKPHKRFHRWRFW